MPYSAPHQPPFQLPLATFGGWNYKGAMTKQQKKEGEDKMKDRGIKKTRPKRISRGARYNILLWERAEKVAAKQQTSVRSVIEQALERGLPELEKFFGIEPPSGNPPEDQS